MWLSGLQDNTLDMQAARDIAVTSLRRSGWGRNCWMFSRRAFRRHAKACRPRPRHRVKARHYIFRRADHWLDPIMTDVINHLIRDCVRELGATTLTITHDMTSVRAIADKTALLYQGRIIGRERRTSLNNPMTRF